MQSIQSLSANKEWVTCLSVHPTQNIFASGSADRTVNIWDIKCRKSIQCIKGNNNDIEHNSIVWGLNFTRDGSCMISGDSDGIVVTYRVQ
jgi:WD40 repeat protein